MAKVVRIGNNIINLDLLAYSHFLVPGAGRDHTTLVLGFGNSAATARLYDVEAEQLWHFLCDEALDITLLRSIESEAIAP